MSDFAARPVRASRMGLSARLRERTREAHERAESAPFVGDLLGGRLALDAYTALVAQNHRIYSCLERHAAGLIDHPVVGPVVFDELARVPALEADLAVLLGPHWARRSGPLVRPTTEHYVEYLDDVLDDWPVAFAAHHYVRYLGDLSGGQIVARRVLGHFGEAAADAVSFYRFPAIPRIKPFKDLYRSVLDGLPVGVLEQDQLADEAVFAFELNRSVFLDLGDRFAAQPESTTAANDSAMSA